jgi:hypothetical protein
MAKDVAVFKRLAYSTHIDGIARSFSNNSVVAQTMASRRSGEPAPW